eukprot:CAMPEP_0168751606 /NCGR_PEP_ID=MMETSP0724-20121128/17924_1 /TAXON_ID=265536 /ORGANISM="Amphiprora sp., Strain CCMP467" /LENGTH=51 /DNA_ID=CAMNT_0008799763 /DNA_START=40 /DNA_END=191 /DNA_ORIENTATION=-
MTATHNDESKDDPYYHHHPSESSSIRLIRKPRSILKRQQPGSSTHRGRLGS